MVLYKEFHIQKEQIAAFIYVHEKREPDGKDAKARKNAFIVVIVSI
jgi:hypothetical protein